MTARPNFLLFITDQQRADHLGAYGNRVVATPHLDRLAAAGWRADNLHVASPICMPNRASLLTGRMPSAHGVRHNGIPLSLDATTFTDVLREEGYATALVGKSHLQNMTGKAAQWPPQSQPRLPREARRLWPGRYDQEWTPNWQSDPRYDMDLPFYGFAGVDLVIDHGDDLEGHYRRWLRQQDRGIDRLIGADNAIATPRFELSKCGQAWRTRVPEELYSTAWIADRTIDRLGDYARAGTPFFIQCSFPDPHHPFTPPGKYWDMYRPEDMTLPRSFHSTHARPPHVAWLHAQRDAGKAVKHTPALFACTEREAREAIALNYGSIANIDASIGRVLDALARLGLDENTVVIFTTDHGDYLGDHQLLLKGPVHYRSVIRCPFIWHDPQQPARGTSDALAQTTDLAPTILERAGVPAFNGIQGRSLLPLMRGEIAAVRESLVIEEEGQRVYMGFAQRIRMRTLVTDRYRLSVYDGVPWGELYDLREDLDETVNLWIDAGHAARRDALMAELARAMLAQSDTSPYPSALA